MLTGGPMRRDFQSELDQLRLQVELMGLRVDANLERMLEVLRSGDCAVAAAAIAGDDDVDAMNVSLTERCYTLLGLESPVASDLRFVVSVLRIVGELERVGDLALRVLKLAPDHRVLSSATGAWTNLCVVAEEAVALYRAALRAWSAQDLVSASQLADRGRLLDPSYERLTTEVMALEGPDAVPIAIRIFAAGRALERIADHAGIIGARLRYLLTGEQAHLAAEVR
jgi:phosphate transport system protein